MTAEFFFKVMSIIRKQGKMLKGTTNQSIILHSVKICFNNKGKVNLGARR